MKNSKIREIVIPTLSLFLICLVATALLGFTNRITEPRIKQLAAETEQKTKAEVLSTADSFSEAKTLEYDGREYTYYEGTKDGSLAGYVFSTSAKGYGGDISVMVGVDAEGSVTGVSILEISETAGLGMNAKNESFRNQFAGKNSEISVIKNGTPSDNEIQALTGATITSKAMTKAVNTALELYKIAGGENNG
ncbi:MAG: RnfABCDGE type electron transport complex subunit G [Ruminococcaceae bacterium]|nr:RnfABCDGE type electron transport complex subunit G [Oscillospiraceae bacterium]